MTLKVKISYGRRWKFWFGELLFRFIYDSVNHYDFFLENNMSFMNVFGFFNKEKKSFISQFFYPINFFNIIKFVSLPYVVLFSSFFKFLQVHVLANERCTWGCHCLSIFL